MVSVRVGPSFAEAMEGRQVRIVFDSWQRVLKNVFEVRKGSEKRLKARLGPKGLRTGHRITIMNKCRQRQTTKFGAAAPLRSVRRNNVTRPGNIDDYRCPRRNIAP